ncbi:MAG: hypothetical protein ACKO6D_12390 [Rubrivivax sp.]
MNLLRAPARLVAHTVWLRVACSSAYGPRPHRRLQAALMRYLHGSGITPCVLPTRVGLFGTGRPILPQDWSSVIGWMLGQPEVVFVHREFPRTRQETVQAQANPARRLKPVSYPGLAQTWDAAFPELPEITPEEVLWQVEDVWLRLAACVPVIVEADPVCEDQSTLRFRGLVSSGADEFLEKALLDPALYRWRAGGRAGTFVEAIDVEDDDVLLRLTPMRVLRRWEDGATLVWRVMGVVRQLRLVDWGS